MRRPMPPAIRETTRERAQARADRIRAFREELAQAEADGALRLDEIQRTSLTAYHDAALAALAERFDVDRSAGARHLSLGLRVVSFLGAVALTAAAVLFFQRIWGLLPTTAQIAIVWLAPIAAVVGAALTARVERTLYVTGLLAILAFGLFVLNVSVLGTIFNMAGSALPLLAWAAFALALAYAWDLRLLLAAGAACFIGYFAAWIVGWSRLPPEGVIDRPEALFVPAILIVLASGARINTHRSGFAQTLRLVGCAAIAIALLVLGESGGMSRLPFDAHAIEYFYQIVGLTFAAGLVGVGIRRGWTESVNLGAALVALLLFLRFMDWWWDWMPKYLFFLIIGLAALVFVLALRRLRRLEDHAA